MDPVSGNMIRSLFNNKQSADKLRARPDGVEKHTVKTLGMLGAGMMGAGIALVSARAGMKVYLLDSSLESAEKGTSGWINWLVCLWLRALDFIYIFYKFKNLTKI